MAGAMLEDTVLDVAIGLTFTFALLSVITTSITEGCANLMRTRSRALGNWLEHMLGDKLTSDELMRHPMIRSMCPRDRAVPDYIPAETFAMVLLETLAPATGDKAVRTRPRDWDEFQQLLAGLAERPKLRMVLDNLAIEARGDLRAAERAIADWFDGSMQRLSGWYARHAQLAAFVFASLITVSFNADALMIADALWQDESLRAAVVEKASAEASEKAREQAKAEPDAESASTTDPGIQAAADTLRRLDAFPLGWSTDTLDPRCVPGDPSGWLAKLLGLGLTVLAITLGAPFWFDLLSRFVGLRSTGKPPQTRTQRASEADA
jgi:hypothetical protein